MRRKLIILFLIFSYILLISLPCKCQGNIQILEAFILSNGMFDLSYSLYAVNDTNGFNDDEYHFTDFSYAYPVEYIYETYPELPCTERCTPELEEIKIIITNFFV